MLYLKFTSFSGIRVAKTDGFSRSYAFKCTKKKIKINASMCGVIYRCLDDNSILTVWYPIYERSLKFNLKLWFVNSLKINQMTESDQLIHYRLMINSNLKGKNQTG